MSESVYCRVPSNRPLNLISVGKMKLSDPNALSVNELFLRNEKGKVVKHYILDNNNLGRFKSDHGLPSGVLRLVLPDGVFFDNLPITGTLNLKTGEIRLLSPRDIVVTIEEKL